MPRYLLLLTAWILGIMLPQSAAARDYELHPFPVADQAGVWTTVVWSGPEVAAGSADEACQIQHESFNPNATYQSPAYIDDDDMGCRWIPKQLGGPPDSNTILPTSVRLVCPPDYHPVAGVCRSWSAYSVECSGECGATPQSGTPMPLVGHPISINSGYKVQAETDYESADGLLTVERRYLSREGDGWKTLIPGYIAIGGGWWEEATYYSSAGGIDPFKANPRGDENWTYDVPTFAHWRESTSRRKLSMVGPPSVGRTAFFEDTGVSGADPAEMRLDMANGEYILFRRANGTSFVPGTRLMVPVEHGKPGGYTRWFDYADAGYYPYRVRDSLGREIAVNWTDAPGSTRELDKVISRLDLPDGTRLDYEYDDSGSSYTLAMPQWVIDRGWDLRGAANLYIVTAGRENRLRSVTRRDALGASLWKRAYDYAGGSQPYALTAVRDGDNNVLASYTYAWAGKLASSVLAGGVQPYSFEHLRYFNLGWTTPEDRMQVRRVTGPLGRVDEYMLYRRESAAAIEPWAVDRIDGLATATTPADERDFGYRSHFGINLMITDEFDKLGRQTYNWLDVDNGRPLVVNEAWGTGQQRATTIEWHPTLDLPTRIDRGGLRIDTVYTATAMVASQTLTDITTHSSPYATAGQTRTTTYNWGANSRLLSVNGPRAAVGLVDDITSFAYDLAGNLSAITNPLGHVTSFAGYDANGRPGSMTDANGTQTQFAYDLLGRLTSSNVKHPSNAALDAVTSYDYDGEGRVTGITLPATEKLSFLYNLAGQLLEIASADGEKQTFTYDLMGNVTQEQVKASGGTPRSTISRTFDALGRMLTQTLGPGRTTSWTYDKEGNPLSVTSPRNHATNMAFDALNRLVSTLSPDTGTTANSFDQNDGITAFTDAAGVVTNFVRNGFGQVIQEVSPDRGTSVYHYGVAGDLVSAVDGRGQQVDYARDILGRVTQKTPVGRPATEIVAYGYDSGGAPGCYCTGRLASMTDASGTTSFGYDHRGNLNVKDTSAGELRWTHDLADRITSMRHASGREVNWARDSKGRVNAVQTRANSGAAWQMLASNIAYEPFGAMKAADLGNGLKLSLDWGSDGRLAAKRLYTALGADVWHLGYGYDLDDNITSITDLVNPANSRSFAYDSVDRLTRTDGSGGTFAREDYLHDANGNRITVERRVGVSDATPAESDAYARTSGTNRIASVALPTGTRSFSHDARGNLITEARPGGASITLDYDGHARLASYAQVGGDAQAMLHNGFDERVGLTTTPAGAAASQRRYLYDSDHRIVGEYGATIADLRAEYIWLLPEVGGATSFGGDDGLGGYMPLAIAVPAGGGASAINWVQGNHLGTPVVTTDISGTVITPLGHDRIGFPGQSQQHADLYYNYYRDYDPMLGRYVQADPIGLRGGANPYTYAEGNPLKFMDPYGRSALPAAGDAAAWLARRNPYVMAGIGGMALWMYAMNEWQKFVNDCLPTSSSGGYGDGFPMHTINGGGTILIKKGVPRGGKVLPKPPSDAHDATGAKAPGKPQPGTGAGEDGLPSDGFDDSRYGERWGETADGKKGWLDDKGNVWVPTGSSTSGRSPAHGGPHWDVQINGGGYRNVRPAGSGRQ